MVPACFIDGITIFVDYTTHVCCLNAHVRGTRLTPTTKTAVSVHEIHMFFINLPWNVHPRYGITWYNHHETPIKKNHRFSGFIPIFAAFEAPTNPSRCCASAVLGPVHVEEPHRAAHVHRRQGLVGVHAAAIASVRCSVGCAVRFGEANGQREGYLMVIYLLYISYNICNVCLCNIIYLGGIYLLYIYIQP